MVHRSRAGSIRAVLRLSTARSVAVFACVSSALFGSARARAQDVGELAVIADNHMILDALRFPTAHYVERTACAFYQTHADRYDAMFVFTNQRLSALSRTQQGWYVKS